VKLPRIASRDEWQAARTDLLAKEKELSKAYDAVSEQRRALPMVEVDKEYVFEGPDGSTTLTELFAGRPQLITYHFMWRWDLDAGCPVCSLVVDNVGDLAHLHATNTSFAVVTRGPWENVDKFRHRMGWTVPFYSSYGSDFNYDFHATLDQQIAPAEYNFAPTSAVGEAHAISVFLRDGDRIFHTYSAFARGCEILLGTFHYLDLTPLGRQEDGGIMSWVRHHDSYDQP
jgi:predicted dithiol-disulfide oxidoreductase (DUF899 family)